MASFCSLLPKMKILSDSGPSSIPKKPIYQLIEEGMQDPRIQEMYDAVKRGENVFATGCAGAGKSYAMRIVLAKLSGEKWEVACTAATGTASVPYSEMRLQGKTVHSWAGLGKEEHTAEEIISYMANNRMKCEAIKAARVLGIDEISMISAETLELLDKVLKGVRQKPAPFGDLRVIFSGDFMQLPPVSSQTKPRRMAYKSLLWERMNFHYITFDTPYRFQRDLQFYEMIKRARMGELTNEDKDKLISRLHEYNSSETDIKPTNLFPLRHQAKMLNQKELTKLPGDEKIYHAQDAYITKKSGKFVNMAAIPIWGGRLLKDAAKKNLKLKIGAQVMVTKNLGSGIVNGTLGVVVELGLSTVDVKLLDGRIVLIGEYKHEILLNKTDALHRFQLPLILAYALTVHKAQGSSLDLVCIDIGPKIFAPGQAFVALSRARTLEGVYLKSFDPKSMRADTDAKVFVKKIEMTKSSGASGVSQAEDEEQPPLKKLRVQL